MLHLRGRRKASWLRHEEEVREFQEVESEKSQGTGVGIFLSLQAPQEGFE